MRILSFDTSTHILQLALLHGGEVVLERQTEPSGSTRQEAASRLIPEIDSLLSAAGWDAHELSLVVVGVGPGSFTGTRIAAITARTLAWALGVPLIGITRLEALAVMAGLPAGVILSAGAGGFFAAAYARSGMVLAPMLLAGAQLPGLLEKLARQSPQINNWAADAQASLEPCLNHCLPTRAGNVAVTQAQLAWERISMSTSYTCEGGATGLARDYPWSEVLPLYLRNPSVTVKGSHGNKHQAHEAG
jgi:tRNA threonylcarbamoyl adenosine modification protein YeaZ